MLPTRFPMLAPFLLIGGPLACSTADPVAWTELDTLRLDPEAGPVQVDLSPSLSGGRGAVLVTARADDGLFVESLGTRLTVAPDPGFRGSSSIALVATDRDGSTAQATLPVVVGDAACPVVLRHVAHSDSADRVLLDGDLLDAAGGSGEFAEVAPGEWELQLDLAPGAWSYRIVEELAFSEGAEQRSYCDQQAAEILCPAGYKEPWETDWSHDCSVPDSPCDSLLVVDACDRPQLRLDVLEIDRPGGRFSASGTITPGIDGATLDGLDFSFDGQPVEVETTASTGDDGVLSFHVERSGLASGRHTLRATATDASGAESDPLWVPFWTDVDDPRDGWRDGIMYYAFVDRMANGDPGNDGSEGASGTIADFAGGDWAGVEAMLPYLDELGVRTLWLSNPQDNAEDAWPGQCDAEYAGYHAYWPDAARETEEHFGTQEELHSLVQSAHDRGMRVVMDWVANHVHEDHPYAARSEWFNSQALCGDADNWNTVPESCWFASYLPDLDYGRADVMDVMLDDALWWARTFDLDGFRVDAAKHMPHSVQVDLQARILAQVEHRDAGGDEEFWTVGETFDNADQIAAYVGPDQLDGQFDFPLYYTIRAALGTRGATLNDLSASMADADARYDGALMSNFLGNHDVTRFITEIAWGGGDICSGDPLAEADLPGDAWVYERLALAWAFVLTRPEVPLVYYGDELALPGFNDPDNRQPLWWYTGDIPTSVGDAASSVTSITGNTGPADVLYTVAALGQARRAHPALYGGDETEWWLDDGVMAWARVTDGDAALVVLNASDEDRWLSNGATFAGLPASGSLFSVLDGETVSWSDDLLELRVAARSARVLVTP